MATASLNIRLNYSQVLDLARQLSDEDKLQLNRALAAELRKVKLQKLLYAMTNQELTSSEIDAEVEYVRQLNHEKRC